MTVVGIEGGDAAFKLHFKLWKVNLVRIECDGAKNVHNRNCSFKEKSNSTSKMTGKWIIVDIVKYKLSLAHS